MAVELGEEVWKFGRREVATAVPDEDDDGDEEENFDNHNVCSHLFHQLFYQWIIYSDYMHILWWSVCVCVLRKS